MASSTEIRNKALTKLGVIAIGDTPETAHSTDVDAAYVEVYAMLEDKNLTSWASTAAIPSDLVDPVVALVAYARLNEYACQGERRQHIMSEAGMNGKTAVRTIRSIVTPEHESAQDAEYF